MRVHALGGWAVTGVTYGLATSWIPAPDETSLFWLGNFCTPWLVLAFLAGRKQPSAVTAAASGSLSTMACVVGFYLRFLTLDHFAWGLPPSASVTEVAVTNVSHWLVFIAPWVFAALVGGLLYGALGFAWRRSRSLMAGFALCLPFIAEPVLWPLKNGYYQGPWSLWLAEVIIGLLVLGHVISVWRRSSPPVVSRPLH